jgi:broad specificity phosphatase PhoE
MIGAGLTAEYFDAMIGPVAQLAVFCSPMKRALQTAHPLAEKLGVAVHVAAELCEVGGHFDSVQSATTAKDLFASFHTSDVSRLPSEGPWDEGRGLESAEGAHQRAMLLVDEWKSEAADEKEGEGARVKVVMTHDKFLAVLLQVLVGISPEVGYFMMNTATTCIELRRDAARGCAATLHWVNRIDHFLVEPPQQQQPLPPPPTELQPRKGEGGRQSDLISEEEVLSQLEALVEDDAETNGALQKSDGRGEGRGGGPKCRL